MDSNTEDARLRAMLGDVLRGESSASRSRLERADELVQRFSSPGAAFESLARIIALAPHLIRQVSRLAALPSLIPTISQRVPASELSCRLAEFWRNARAGAVLRLAREEAVEPVIIARFRVAAKKSQHPWPCCLALEYVARPNRITEAFDALPFETTELAPILLRALVDLPGQRILCDFDLRLPLEATATSRYHPERMRISRQFAKRFADRVAPGEVGLSADVADELQREILDLMRERHVDFPVVLRDRYPERLSVIVGSEVVMLAFYLVYRASGKEIFDFPARLVEMMRHSDAGEIKVSQIRAPYRAQYIHFGVQEDLEIAPAWPCDGAYVQQAEDGALTVRLVGRPKRFEEVERWHIRPEPQFTYRFETKDADLDLDTAVTVAIERDLLEMEIELANFIASEAPKVAAEQRLSVPSVVERARAVYERHHAQVKASKGIAHKALSLVVNALCYLTAYPDDSELQWPDGAPAALRLQADNASPKKRDAAMRQLASLGFSRVRICGRHLRHEAPETSAAGAAVRPHWRRGHWRNQAHGQGRQLRRLVWIMPMLIHADALAADEEIPGHIYRPEGTPQLRVVQQNDAAE